MSESKPDDDNMTPEERLAYLRERGILVEIPEDRKAKSVTEALKDADNDDDLPKETITFVEIPHDSSKPMRELSFSVPNRLLETRGDILVDYLKPFFSSTDSDKNVDLSLFQKQAAQHLGSQDAPGTVSDAALKEVAKQANVETFSLVHPTPSNNFTAIHIYLDEIGMLKRLPLNARANEFATKAGFNPAPHFYGTVYLGRVKTSPKVRNLSFEMGVDTASDAEWLKKATMDNLEHQTSMNRITGRNEVQAAVDGEDGVAKAEDGYSWTQTEDEVELVVLLDNDALAKEINVKFLPKSVQIKFRKEPVLALQLFERVDPDGCTWTLDKTNATEKRNLIVTLEKGDEASWPRITK